MERNGDEREGKGDREITGRTGRGGREGKGGGGEERRRGGEGKAGNLVPTVISKSATMHWRGVERNSTDLRVRLEGDELLATLSGHLRPDCKPHNDNFPHLSW